MNNPIRWSSDRKAISFIVCLSALLFIALVSSIVFLINPKDYWLSSQLGIILALWSSGIAVVALLFYRNKLLDAKRKVDNMRLFYEVQLDKEVLARLEHEHALERNVYKQLTADYSSEIYELRRELHELKDSLEQITGAQFNDSIKAILAASSKIELSYQESRKISVQHDLPLAPTATVPIVTETVQEQVHQLPPDIVEKEQPISEPHEFIKANTVEREDTSTISHEERILQMRERITSRHMAANTTSSSYEPGKHESPEQSEPIVTTHHKQTRIDQQTRIDRSMDIRERISRNSPLSNTRSTKDDIDSRTGMPAHNRGKQDNTSQSAASWRLSARDINSGRLTPLNKDSYQQPNRARTQQNTSINPSRMINEPKKSYLSYNEDARENESKSYRRRPVAEILAERAARAQGNKRNNQ